MKTEIDRNVKIQYAIARALTAAAAVTAAMLILWAGSLQSAFAEADFAPMYFMGQEDFEKQDFTVTQIDGYHYEIEGLSQDDVTASLENGEGIWHDSLISPAGSHVTGVLVYFEEGLAVMQVEPENMRGLQGNIINVWKTREKYVHTIDFNMVGETYIIDEPGNYGMKGEVLDTNPEIIELYWLPENDKLDYYGNRLWYEGEEVNDDTAQKLIDEYAMDCIPLESTGMISGFLVSFEDGKLETHSSLLSNNCDYVDIQNGAEGALLLVHELKNCGLYEYGDEGTKKYTIMCKVPETEKEEQQPGKMSAVLSIISEFFTSVKRIVEKILL